MSAESLQRIRRFSRFRRRRMSTPLSVKSLPLKESEYDYKVTEVNVNSNITSNKGIVTNRVVINFELSKDHRVVQPSWTQSYDSFITDYQKSVRFYYFLNLIEKNYSNTDLYESLFPKVGEFNPKALEGSTGILVVKSNVWKGQTYYNLSDIFPDIPIDEFECVEFEDVFDSD